MSKKPCGGRQRRVETCFDESALRKLYTRRFSEMSDEQQQEIMDCARDIISKIKARRNSTPFGVDSALQLFYILGTYLNENSPQR